MKKLNNVLLILLLFPLYASAANHPVDSYFCPEGMYITNYQLKDTVKSKEDWSNGSALNSIEVSEGCLKISVDQEVYNNDKTPVKLALGTIAFKTDDNKLLQCDNLVIGMGKFTKYGLKGNWWLYYNNSEPGFNKKRILRCQIADNGIDSGIDVDFSTEVLEKVIVISGWGAHAITSEDEVAKKRRFGAPRITSEDEITEKRRVGAPRITSEDEAASQKKFGKPTITSEDEVANEKKFGIPTITSEDEIVSDKICFTLLCR